MNTTVLNKHIEWVYICIFWCKSKCQTLGTPSLCRSLPTFQRTWRLVARHEHGRGGGGANIVLLLRILQARELNLRFLRRLGFRGTGPKLPLSILSSREWPNLWQVHAIHGGKSKILSSATFTNDWKRYLEGLESEGAASLKARSFYIYIYLLHSSSFYKLPVVGHRPSYGRGTKCVFLGFCCVDATQVMGVMGWGGGDGNVPWRCTHGRCYGNDGCLGLGWGWW